MSSKQEFVEIMLKSYGLVKHTIDDKKEFKDIYPRLLRLSTSFALVNSYVPVIDQLSSKTKIKKVEDALRRLQTIKYLLTNALWVNQWPGTISESPDRLFVVGNIASNDNYTKLLFLENIFWKSIHGWEDLMLINNNKLLFYLTTHEKFGELFGDVELMQDLSVNYTISTNNTWIITGRQMENTILKRLLT